MVKTPPLRDPGGRGEKRPHPQLRSGEGQTMTSSGTHNRISPFFCSSRGRAACRCPRLRGWRRWLRAAAGFRGGFSGGGYRGGGFSGGLPGRRLRARPPGRLSKRLGGGSKPPHGTAAAEAASPVAATMNPPPETPPRPGSHRATPEAAASQAVAARRARKGLMHCRVP